MDNKLTEWEKEYIEEHIPEKISADVYYEDPKTAVEDVKWLLEIIKKLTSQK